MSDGFAWVDGQPFTVRQDEITSCLPCGDFEVEVRADASQERRTGSFVIDTLAPRHAAILVDLQAR